MGLRLTINVMRRGQSLEQLTFHSDTQRLVKIGKRPTDHVVVHDASVSQIRARITLSATQALLLDLGTAGGVSINGFRVREAQLQEGDQIQIGQITLVVTTCEADAGAGHPFGAPDEAKGATPLEVSAVDTKLRVVSKLGALSPQGLLEAERVIDQLLQTHPNTATPADSFEAPADPWGAAFEAKGAGPQNPSPQGMAPAASPFAPAHTPPPAASPLAPGHTPPPAAPSVPATAVHEAFASDPAPVSLPGVPSLANAAVGQASPPANEPAGKHVPTREKYNTDYLLTDLRRGRRRTYIMAAAVGMAVGGLTWWLTQRAGPSGGPALASAESAASEGASAGEDAGRAADTRAPGAGDTPAPAAGDTGAAAPAGEATAGTRAAAAGDATAATDTSASAEAGSSGAGEATPALTNNKHLAYTLVRERSLADISKWLWGDEHVAEILAEANPQVTGPDVVLAPGTAVRIPRQTTITVQPGETLGVIAKAWLGDPMLYTEIHRANAATLATPDAVEVGMQLLIPLLCEPVRSKLNQP